MSILLVDDFDEEREFLQTVLLKAGYGPVVTAESGRQALERLGIMGRRISACDPDVILMDLMMPDIDGLEACRQIRSSERLEHTPIIMITAKTETADLVKGFPPIMPSFSGTLSDKELAAIIAFLKGAQ